VLPDGAYAGQGPLAGICAGLAWAADADALITVPCDTPFLPADLVPRLLPAPAFARAGGRDHFLAASWPPSAQAQLRAMLDAEGSRKVERLTRALGARAVEFEDDGRVFANINRREELDQWGRDGMW
jgi:molybdopterin-guanine dinucleotide biosynthesis protein A